MFFLSHRSDKIRDTNWVKSGEQATAHPVTRAFHSQFGKGLIDINNYRTKTANFSGWLSSFLFFTEAGKARARAATVVNNMENFARKHR